MANENSHYSSKLMYKLTNALAPLERLSRCLDSSTLGFILVEDRHILYLNQTARTLLQYNDSRTALGEELVAALDRHAGLGVSRQALTLDGKPYFLRIDEGDQGSRLLTLEPTAQTDPSGFIGPLLSKATELAASYGSTRVPVELSGLCRDLLESAMETPESSKPEEVELIDLLDQFNLSLHLLLPDQHLTIHSLGLCRGIKVPLGPFCRVVLMCLFSAAQETGKGAELEISLKLDADTIVLEVKAQGALPPNGVDSKKSLLLRQLCKGLDGGLSVWSRGLSRVRHIRLKRPAQSFHETDERGSDKLSQTRNSTILLVDDEESVRSVGKAALGRVGFQVLSARDGLEGLELFQKHLDEIDLVLLDLVMPRMGGAECFERLKAIRPDVKVILMSGFWKDNRVNDLVAGGCLRFLKKPFELEELILIIHQAVEG